jgi:hypothetical protein
MARALAHMNKPSLVWMLLSQNHDILSSYLITQGVSIADQWSSVIPVYQQEKIFVTLTISILTRRMLIHPWSLLTP